MNNVLQVMIAMYLGTVLINIVISFIQYRMDQNRAQRAIFLFWMGTLISFFFNGWFPELGLPIVVAASLGTYYPNHFLGTFFAELHDIKLPWKHHFIAFHALLVFSFILYFFDFSFAIYAFPPILGSTVPLFMALYKTIRHKKYPLTTVQKLFVVTCFVFAVHLLDWPYFKTNDDLIIIGFWIAFILMHTLSIIAPFMGNENLLQRRNEKLSDEVKEKAVQLTAAESKLWESNKLASLGRMAGGVAHEINNPMQIIALQANEFNYFGKLGPIPSEQAIKGAHKLTQMIQRISKITESLRRVARDRRTVEKEKNDLIHIINDTINLCQNKLSSLKIDFSTELPPSPQNVNCNAIEISQVLLNLLNNAVDAVEHLDYKSIKLTLQKTNSLYRIFIDDSGKIDPHLVSKIMEPFFTTKAVGKGTGLGLSISKSMAEDHQGNLYVDTSHHTTRFVLELPQ